MRLQHDGKRETFSLNTAKLATASTTARDIAVFLKANGWDATFAKFKPTAIERPEGGTVGEFLEAQAARSSLKPATFKLYAEKLRQIAAFVGDVESSERRFDYRFGGTQEWRKLVHAVELSAITPETIMRWRASYLARSDGDPVKRKSAERSVASILRCARALFSAQPNNPFATLKIRAERSMRYRSEINPSALLQEAERELRAPNPQVFLALSLCLWAGLRKKEADLLEWANVDFARGIIRIARTKYFSPKTEESQREVDLPADVMATLPGFKGKTPFVLKGRAPKPNALYRYYRARKTWDALAVWLRSKGITDQKAIHALRKESGSLIARQFGIEAARAHLGHRDIQTTSAHYVTKKERHEIKIT